MLVMILSLVLLALLASWIFAELRLRVEARIIGGIACMIIIGVTIHFADLVVPYYEQGFHREAMFKAEECLRTGETVRALQALHAYNNIAQTGSTYSASMEMRDLLLTTNVTATDKMIRAR